MAGVIVTDLVDLIPVLAAAYGVILGAVALATGWQLFRDRTRSRHRAVVPPVGATDVIEHDDDEGAR